MMSEGGVLGTPLPALNDAEGHYTGAIPVVDAHVHLFPSGVFDAIWRWFDSHGWPIRYKLYSEQVIQFLLQRGVRHMVGLHYAHKPGMARALNSYMAGLAQKTPQLTGLATVQPGEPNAKAILQEAFAAGLRGVKLHCHVQCFAPDEDRLADVYDACVQADVPLVMHAGREPKSPAYHCDPHELCSAERIAQVLSAYPRLRLCVPHLGADEYPAYAKLLERYENLWLDTTMMVAGYFPLPTPLEMLQEHAHRIMYGTDFPNIPYAWDRELKMLSAHRWGSDVLPRLLHGSAQEFFRLPAVAQR